MSVGKKIILNFLFQVIDEPCYEARQIAANEEGINAENKKGMITHHCRYEAPQFDNAILLIRRDKAPFLFFAFNLMLAVRCFHYRSFGAEEKRKQFFGEEFFNQIIKSNNYGISI